MCDITTVFNAIMLQSKQPASMKYTVFHESTPICHLQSSLLPNETGSRHNAFFNYFYILTSRFMLTMCIFLSFLSPNCNAFALDCDINVKRDLSDFLRNSLVCTTFSIPLKIGIILPKNEDGRTANSLVKDIILAFALWTEAFPINQNQKERFFSFTIYTSFDIAKKQDLDLLIAFDEVHEILNKHVYHYKYDKKTNTSTINVIATGCKNAPGNKPCAAAMFDTCRACSAPIIRFSPYVKWIPLDAYYTFWKSRNSKHPGMPQLVQYFSHPAPAFQEGNADLWLFALRLAPLLINNKILQDAKTAKDCIDLHLRELIRTAESNFLETKTTSRETKMPKSFFSTALHEIGHYFGLGHNEQWMEASIMNAYAPNSDNVVASHNLTLNDEDIRCINAIYINSINKSPGLHGQHYRVEDREVHHYIY